MIKFTYKLVKYYQDFSLIFLSQDKLSEKKLSENQTQVGLREGDTCCNENKVWFLKVIKFLRSKKSLDNMINILLFLNFLSNLC